MSISLFGCVTELMAQPELFTIMDISCNDGLTIAKISHTHEKFAIVLVLHLIFAVNAVWRMAVIKFCLHVLNKFTFVRNTHCMIPELPLHSSMSLQYAIVISVSLQAAYLEAFSSYSM